MTNKINSIFIILILLVIGGCSKAIDINLSSEMTVVFSKDNSKNIKLTEKDAEYQELQKWLSENKADWYSTSGRYPGGVYIKSGEHGIQVTENHVVIYSTTTEKPKAIYVQEINYKELPLVRTMGQ